ncbi:MAG: cation:proton antiporter [Sandaracinaceae bacterium]
MSGGGHSKDAGGVLRKVLIVLLLVGGVMLVHRFATRASGFDPSAMLALGFVILASYAFGQLVERLGLPHITGYLIAGLALGPSAAHLLPEAYQIRPFDDGVLSSSVIEQLKPLELLAVALIALTAGGELKIASLKRGFGVILAVLGGQIVMIVGLAVAFVIGLSGMIPMVSLPGLGELDIGGAAALGAVLGSISIATSPAATIAVINDVKARGPTTSTLLATVVLKDVVVVVLFAVLSTLAAQMLGLGSSEEALGTYLLKHIGGALLIGAAMGFVMAGYLRYVKREVLLFVVGMVFTAGFVAAELDVESVVLFITAGFVTANFSSEGDHMLETVETLSLPVYVVFFTLAGAKLHLDELASVAGFAVALVALRVFGIWAGTAIGSQIGGASDSMRKHGWLGFVSQAGVAISLATIVGERMGEPGEALSTLIIAGIAVNEIVGPVMLKVGLMRTGETEAGRAHQSEEQSVESTTPAAEEDGRLAPWPTPDVGQQAWGAPLTTASRELNSLVQDLSLDLSHVSRDVAEAPLSRFRENALGYIRELRREFLRHHRRITVQAMADQTELSAAEALRLEQAELAEKWRAAVLTRAARVGQHRAWEPAPILAAVESIAEGLPATFDAPYEDSSFESKPSDGPVRRAGRAWLRMRRGASRTFGDGISPRAVELRALARYHLWGHLPERLEPVAALYAQAEGHLVDRTRSIFEGLVIAYDELAEEVERKARAEAEIERGAVPDDLEGPPERVPAEVPLESRLQDVRARVDEELVLAVQEVDAIAQDLAHRTSVAIGSCLRDFKTDLPIIETPDLRMRSRAASSLYRRRDEKLDWLEKGSLAARETSSALYNRLALEMELHALEGRVKDALEEHATTLGRNVKGRAHRQVMRVHKEILATEQALADALESAEEPEALAEQIRTLAEPVIRIAAEAARVGTTLRDQLTDEGSVTPVLDSLTRAAQNLTDRYRIPAGPLARGEHRLPPQVATVEVPFRDWVMARIETSVAPRLLASTREVAQKVEPLAQSLSELERRVAFNVELAVNELTLLEDEVTPDARRLIQDMIGGALERNRELFGGYADASSQWGEDVRESVRGAVLDGLDELRGGLVDGEVGRMRSQMVRDVRGRRISRVLSELQTSVGRSSRIVRRALAESLGEDRLDRARRLLGLPGPSFELSAFEGNFDPLEPLSSIPMVYRRLFSAQALEAGDILTGRDDALNRTLTLLEGAGGEVGSGALRTVAVVGPDGVGKSAFVNAVLRAKRWSKVRELKLENPATKAEIDAVFDGGGEGQLVVVTGIKWMRAIRPGGFTVLRHFVNRVIADAGKNAFLVRADRLVWEQQREVAPLEDAFPEVIRLDPLEPQALQAAVLARHTVSGYGLVFSQGMEPESRLEELVLQGTTPLSRPQESFFRALHAASGGLLRDALRLWLASVTEVDDTQDFVHLGPVPTPSIYALRKLSDADVLTLYQVARQGWMDKLVCASLFRLDEAAAEARLLSLAHVGILDERDGRYRIALHLRGSTRRLLRERGFVE